MLPRPSAKCVHKVKQLVTITPITNSKQQNTRLFFFFFKYAATPEISPFPLHDALPIFPPRAPVLGAEPQERLGRQPAVRVDAGLGDLDAPHTAVGGAGRMDHQIEAARDELAHAPAEIGRAHV